MGAGTLRFEDEDLQAGGFSDIVRALSESSSGESSSGDINPNSKLSADDDSGLGVGAIAGIVICVILLLISLVCFSRYFRNRYSRSGSAWLRGSVGSKKFLEPTKSFLARNTVPTSNPTPMADIEMNVSLTGNAKI